MLVGEGGGSLGRGDSSLPLSRLHTRNVHVHVIPCADILEQKIFWEANQEHC